MKKTSYNYGSLPLEVHGPHRAFLGPKHSESRLSEGRVLTGSQLDEHELRQRSRKYKIDILRSFLNIRMREIRFQSSSGGGGGGGSPHDFLSETILTLLHSTMALLGST